MTELPTEVAKLSEIAIRKHVEGQYMEAERDYRKTLTAIGDDQSPAYQDVLALNIRLLFAMGEMPNALKVGQQLLSLREKHFGFHHPQTASALRLLAEIKAAQNNQSAATLDIRRALDIWMDSLGWQAPEPDPQDFELHRMAGPRVLLPEFDWINGNLSQSAESARLPAPQEESRRFCLSLEIANAFSWLGLHKTASRLFKAALAQMPQMPPQLVWQNYWCANQAAQSLIATGEVSVAHAFLSQMLKILNAEYKYGFDVAPILLIVLASIERHTRDYESARKNLKQALDLMLELHGDSHVQVASAHVTFADLLVELKENSESERHYDKAIAILESWHGNSDISLVQPLFRKGLMQKASGQFQKAEKSFARALEVLLPRDQGDIDLSARIFEELSHVYMRQGSFQQAQMAQIRGLDLLREHGRPSELLLARCEITMARIYLAVAKYVDAEKNAKNALHVFEKQKDNSKFAKEIGSIFLILAKIDIEQGKLQPASQYLRQAEAAVEQSNDLRLQKELHLEFATLYLHQGQAMKSSARLRELIELESPATAGFSEETLLGMIGLSNLELAMGRPEKVEGMMLSAVKFSERSPDPSGMLIGLNALSQFYITQKNLSAAEAVIERSLAIVEQSSYLGKDPIYARFLHTYADLLFAQGTYEVSTEKLKKARTVYEGCFSSQHPACADVWISIAANLVRRNVEDQADEAVHKAVTINSNTFDLTHYATMRAIAYEAFISIKRERLDVALVLSEKLLPAIQTVRTPPDMHLAEALVALLSLELRQRRNHAVEAIKDYLEKHLKMLLYTFNEDGVEVLLELMSLILKQDNRRLALTIGDTIVEYLSQPNCLVVRRKALLNKMLLQCQDFAHIAECKSLIDKTRASLT